MNSENEAYLKLLRALGIIGSKWNILIIWILKDETLRFSVLQKKMGDVNSKTITKHLKDLEKNKIVTRTVFPEVPPRVEYTLTEQGLTLVPICEEIWKWGEALT